MSLGVRAGGFRGRRLLGELRPFESTKSDVRRQCSGGIGRGTCRKRVHAAGLPGKNIDIDNQQQFNGDIELLIGLPTNCQGLVPALSPKQLYSFCKKVGEKKYDPVAPASAIKLEDDDKSTQVQKLSLENTLEVTPNPFSNQFAVNFKIESQADIQISMLNSLGKVIKVLFSGNKEVGSHQIIENASDLVPGFYFVTLRTPQGIETKKLIKQ